MEIKPDSYYLYKIENQPEDQTCQVSIVGGGFIVQGWKLDCHATWRFKSGLYPDYFIMPLCYLPNDSVHQALAFPVFTLESFRQRISSNTNVVEAALPPPAEFFSTLYRKRSLTFVPYSLSYIETGATSSASHWFPQCRSQTSWAFIMFYTYGLSFFHVVSFFVLKIIFHSIWFEWVQISCTLVPRSGEVCWFQELDNVDVRKHSLPRMRFLPDQHLDVSGWVWSHHSVVFMTKHVT